METANCGRTNLPGDLVSLAVSECDEKMKTAADAVRLLAHVDQCTDAAVERLEAFARPRRDARLLSDLAAAYYVRAQRKDRPSDLVRALDAADQAVALDSAMAGARFNRALAEEALGFSADAIESWNRLRKESTSSWGIEAEQHHARLVSQSSRSAATAWSLNKQRLPIAADAADAGAIRQLVSPYRTAAQRYVEEEVLPAWAMASIEGRSEDAARQILLADMIASALAQLTHDRYLLDGVERIRGNHDPRVLGLLRSGHRSFGLARGLGRDFDSTEAAYKHSELALAAAGSPLRIGALLGRATALTQRAHYVEAAALLHTAGRAASDRHYPYLLARVHSGRGYLLMLQGQHIDALAEYTEARSIFDAAQDLENVGNVQNTIIGLFRFIGHEEFTWRATLQGQRYTAGMVEAQSRHVYLGESALSALELGYPSVALRYQNMAVQLLEDQLSHSPDATVKQLRTNRGIALRTRAGIRAHLGDRDGAQADLAASIESIEDSSPADVQILNGFQARLAEVEAQRLAGSDRKGAIAALSEAIRLASTTQYRSLVASFRMQRAELYRLDGNRAGTEEDLRSAVAALRAEEIAALETPKARSSTAELLWSAYFSRPQEAYRRLIRHYIDDGTDEKAFEYAEKSRGYEPLHLVLKRKDLPAEFRNLIHGGEPLRLEDVERVLPPATFLLQYSVLDDRTYVWIVGNGRFDRRTLPAGERRIKEWTRALQKFADLGEDESFERALIEPYKMLFEEPLALIAKSQAAARIVIVPDRSMHGLPFAALGDGKRHLIEDHPVSVAGSATLYAFSLAQDRQLSGVNGQSVLLVADPAFNQRLDFARDLKRLTAARSEAARIAVLYSSVSRVEPPLMDERATVPEFLRLAAESTIVHLAAHGIASPDAPSRSFLLLAPTEKDSGVIDAERLLTQLQLRKTRLVILSACSSAGGTPVGPEGLAPLVRPLVAAGVPGVVGTLWNVRDNLATEDLLVRFHQHYRDGHDAGQALRLAQMEMLAHPQTGHRAVWAWAAFQMTGYASSPFPASAEEVRRTK